MRRWLKYTLTGPLQLLLIEKASQASRLREMNFEELLYPCSLAFLIFWGGLIKIIAYQQWTERVTLALLSYPGFLSARFRDTVLWFRALSYREKHCRLTGSRTDVA